MAAILTGRMGIIGSFAVALLLAASPSVDAIRCYECNSNSNAACADSGQIGQLYTDCSNLPGRDRCLKTKGPGTLVTRACASHVNIDGCSSNTLTNMETCLCSSDYCNGASQLPARIFPIGLSVLLVSLFGWSLQ